MKKSTLSVVLISIIVLLVVGLNFRQLFAAWTIRQERERLIDQAINASAEFQNPAPVEDNFDGILSPEFWKFVVINGAGKVSNDSAFGAVSMTLSDGLEIHHQNDSDFKNKTAGLMERPAPQRYNNMALIGGAGYQPTRNEDVILEFPMSVGEGFYGTAGVIFQQEGTLQADGMFKKHFDMFGVSIIGNESSALGHNGTVCYLALNWTPVLVQSLNVDSRTPHVYQIHLHWVSQMEWLGSIFVDGKKLYEMAIPPFGPVEVQVWSDNYLVKTTPKRWWEIGDAMDLSFQNGGKKLFSLGYIKIYTEDIK